MLTTALCALLVENHPNRPTPLLMYVGAAVLVSTLMTSVAEMIQKLTISAFSMAG